MYTQMTVFGSDESAEVHSGTRFGARLHVTSLPVLTPVIPTTTIAVREAKREQAAYESANLSNAEGKRKNSKAGIA
jgi:hypothetical protein